MTAAKLYSELTKKLDRDLHSYYQPGYLLGLQGEDRNLMAYKITGELQASYLSTLQQVVSQIEGLEERFSTLENPRKSLNGFLRNMFVNEIAEDAIAAMRAANKRGATEQEKKVIMGEFLDRLAPHVAFGVSLEKFSAHVTEQYKQEAKKIHARGFRAGSYTEAGETVDKFLSDVARQEIAEAMAEKRAAKSLAGKVQSMKLERQLDDSGARQLRMIAPDGGNSLRRGATFAPKTEKKESYATQLYNTVTSGLRSCLSGASKPKNVLATRENAGSIHSQS